MFPAVSAARLYNTTRQALETFQVLHKAVIGMHALRMERSTDTNASAMHRPPHTSMHLG